MRYFPHTKESINKMLAELGKHEIDDLFCSIPKEARIKNPLNLPNALDELSLKKQLLALNADTGLRSFLGAGATAHFVPEWVSQQLLRAEWYTSYTPYQAEVSQGTLQAIFEFQSMVASLFGLEVANASMYDGATALVEALLMAVRITKRNKVVLASTIHPEYYQTVQSYLSAADISLLSIGFDNNTGISKLDELSLIMKNQGEDVAAIATFSPNFFGQLEDLAAISEVAKKNNSLFIAGTTDCSSLGILKSFGSYGADIAVGEGLGLVGPIQMGGPGLGLFACKESFLRQMPGRLVGMTNDKKGLPGYVLTLSTREQHIRREKATSNICTNHNLMALAFSMTLSSYGKLGFLELAQKNLQKTIYFRNCLAKKGLKSAWDGAHYNETVINLGSMLRLNQCLAEARNQKMLAGLALEKFYPNLDGYLMVCTTELHEDHELELLASIIAGTK